MADKQINELTVATDISDATTFPANNNTPTYEAQQVSVGHIANFIGARANAMHNIGDVFTNKSSKVELNPGCVPLWTGEYITNAKNIYPEFYNYLKVQNPGICISKQEYDTQVSSGECRYFVIDEEDGSIRFPKYNFVEPDYPYIYVFNASIPQSTSQGAEYTAALVSKVSKAGDTMTGSLAVKVNGNGLNIKHPEADITTTPTEDKYNSIYFMDKNGRYGGVLDHCFKATGSDYVRLLVCKNDGSNSTIRGLEVVQKTENNNESWATFTTDRVNINTPDNAQNVEATNAKWVMSKFVSKSGDTMTDTLIIDKTGKGGQALQLVNSAEIGNFLEFARNTEDTLIARFYTQSTEDTNTLNFQIWGNESATANGENALSIVRNRQTGSAQVFCNTPANTSNDRQIATTAWVNSKILSQSIYQNKTALSSGTINLVENCSIYTHSPTANTTYTFNTTSLSKKSQCVVTFELMLKMPSTSITITFPTVKWLNETVPSLVNGKTNILAFRSIDGGATWMGNLQGIIA